MPRVTHVQKARKDYPNFGIKKGESYYWWKFRYGSKQMSKTPPRPQQLTQSEFLSNVYDLQDRLMAIGDVSHDTVDDFKTEVQEIIDEINNLADEQEDKLSNMPEQFQNVGSGEMLSNRVDSLREWSDELDSNLSGIDEDESLHDQEAEIDNVINCSYNGD